MSRPPGQPEQAGTGGPPAVATDVADVPVALVRPLRAEVLRPGQPAEASVFPGDDDPRSAHIAVRDTTGRVLSVGSLLPEEPPWPVDRLPGGCWRIRGMATAAPMRKLGLGRMVLDELLRRAGGGGDALVWCNARVPAQSFYRRAGFTSVGEPFVVPVIGEHQAMQRQVPRA